MRQYNFVNECSINVNPHIHLDTHSYLVWVCLLGPEPSFYEATIALEIVARKDWCGGTKYYYFVSCTSTPLSLAPQCVSPIAELNLLKNPNTVESCPLNLS